MLLHGCVEPLREVTGSQCSTIGSLVVLSLPSFALGPFLVVTALVTAFVFTSFDSLNDKQKNKRNNKKHCC